MVAYCYRDMLDFPRSAVIVENGAPPADVLENARAYRFTATASVRRLASRPPSSVMPVAMTTARKTIWRFTRTVR